MEGPLLDEHFALVSAYGVCALVGVFMTQLPLVTSINSTGGWSLSRLENTVFQWAFEEVLSTALSPSSCPPMMRDHRRV
jgi:hypothetical protein